MSAYSIGNLKKEVEDSMGERAPGIEGRFARKHLDSERLGISYLRYSTGVRSPSAHSHREQEEAYVVISGSGQVRLDDEIRELRCWDVVGRVGPHNWCGRSKLAGGRRPRADRHRLRSPRQRLVQRVRRLSLGSTRRRHGLPGKRATCSPASPSCGGASDVGRVARGLLSFSSASGSRSASSTLAVPRRTAARVPAPTPTPRN